MAIHTSTAISVPLQREWLVWLSSVHSQNEWHETAMRRILSEIWKLVLTVGAAFTSPTQRDFCFAHTVFDATVALKCKVRY